MNEKQIEEIKKAMKEPEEPKSEFQNEIEKLTKTIKTQEHNLKVNGLLLDTLTANDYIPGECPKVLDDPQSE